VLAGVGSGLGAIVVFTGAVYSAVQFARRHSPGTRALAGGNALIALGTLILSSGGLLQGFVAADTAFAISLAAGISVIYAGFVVASGGRRSRVATASDSARRITLPPIARGNSSTSSTRVGNL